MKTHPSSLAGGFTLIELMMVVLLIGLLMAILMPAFSSIRRKATSNRAETEAKMLANSIRHYHQEYTDWPGDVADWNTIVTNHTRILNMLVAEGNDHKMNFIEIAKGTKTLCDPFRSNLPYRIRIDTANNAVTVSSYGPDCKAGTDDISVTY